MSEDCSFRDLLRRVRGDAEAAAELVRQFEPTCASTPPARATPASAGCCILDLADISQSVLRDFATRAALGQFNLEVPGDLIGLLVTMAIHQLPSQLPCCGMTPRHTVAGPEGVAGAEMIQEFLRRMTAEERQLVELRAAGLGWDEVAARVGGTSEAVRKQFKRAILRVERQLGLQGDSDA